MDWISTDNYLPPAKTMILFHSVSENFELMGIYTPKSNQFISESVHYYADDVPYWAEITNPTRQSFGDSDLIKHERKRCEHKNDQIAFLWKLLDGISTAGDIYKPEIDGYFKAVELLCNSRGKVASSYDGIYLTIKEFFEND